MLKRLLFGILLIAAVVAVAALATGKDPGAVASKIIGNGIELASKIIGNGKDADTGKDDSHAMSVASKIIGNGSPMAHTTAEACVKAGGEWRTTNECGIGTVTANR